MTVWIECGGEFIAADVIRWREAVWQRRGPRGTGKPFKVGDREVIAEVLDGPDADGWVVLLVRSCTAPKDGRPADQLKKGLEMRRKASTIARGHAERLAWEDESARVAVLGSRFLRPPAVSYTPRGARES